MWEFCHFCNLGIWNDTNTLQCEHIVLSITNTKKHLKCDQHICTKYHLIQVIWVVWVTIIKRISTSSITIATSSSTSQLLCAASTSCRSTVLANVHVRYILSPVRLSSVCPTQPVEIFGNIFRHLVPWPSANIHRNVTDIVPEELLRWEGVRRKRGSQI